jgi:hypothetical protein
MNMLPHCSMEIVWIDEDRCFVASLPEWGDLATTFGLTYEDAVRDDRCRSHGSRLSIRADGT